MTTYYKLGADCSATAEILDEVFIERRAQDAKWGEQNHPDHGGWNPEDTRIACERQAGMWKKLNESRAKGDRVGWDGILLEEVYEAVAEEDPAKLRTELIQVAAVAAAWVKAIDRRADQ